MRDGGRHYHIGCVVVRAKVIERRVEQLWAGHVAVGKVGSDWCWLVIKLE